MATPMMIDPPPPPVLTAESGNNFMIAPIGSSLFGLVHSVGGGQAPQIHLALGVGGPAPNAFQRSTIRGVLLAPIPTGAGAGQGHRALADALGINYHVVGPGNTVGPAVGFALVKEGTSIQLIRRSGFNTPVYGSRDMSDRDERVLADVLGRTLGQPVTTEMRT